MVHSVYICAVCVRVLLSAGSCKTWSESGVFGLCQAVTSRHHLGSVTCTYYSTASRITLCLRKFTSPCHYFWYNSFKNEPILVIFDTET